MFFAFRKMAFKDFLALCLPSLHFSINKIEQRKQNENLVFSGFYLLLWWWWDKPNIYFYFQAWLFLLPLHLHLALFFKEFRVYHPSNKLQSSHPFKPPHSFHPFNTQSSPPQLLFNPTPELFLFHPSTPSSITAVWSHKPLWLSPPPSLDHLYLEYNPSYPL